MKTYGWVIALCALMIVATIIAMVVAQNKLHARRRAANAARIRKEDAAKEAEKQAAILAWVEKVEATDTDDALFELGDPNFCFPSDKRTEKALEKWANGTANARARQWRTNVYDAAPVNIRPREMLKAYCNSINLTAAFDESEAEVGKRFMNDMAVTFELFYSEGDLDAMEYYWEIFDDYLLEEFCQEYGVTPVPTLPNNWDTLVDWNVPEPEPDLYVCSKTLTPQGIQTLAGQAIATRDALLAKRVLVLSLIEDFNSAGDVIYPYRDALGDHMLFVLQMLVADPANIDQYLGCVDW